ncbi:MAG: alpha/beta fold hydrolase [Alphaproteobacteria bacterium]|nr:MAG: alpha/beta fold hydrolase [Alphaproteobacteria bacterium]
MSANAAPPRADAAMPAVMPPEGEAVPVRPFDPLDAFMRLSNALARREEEPSQLDDLTRLAHAATAKATMGLSPVVLALAFTDWWLHLAHAPGKQAELAQKALRKSMRFTLQALKVATRGQCEACIEPLAQDRRFADPEWRRAPFSLIYQGFLLTQQWWHNATTNVRGVSARNEHIASFAARQILDIFAPSNFPWTNPVLMQRTIAEGGANLMRGAINWFEDAERAIANRKPVGTENFRPGRDLAVTPGKVIFRNRLIELIQYTPATNQVHAEPVLIVPAWIMKYYILDLAPGASLIAYLVEQGFTVFAISWHNPRAEDRDLSMDDYRRLGIMDALAAIEAVLPGRRVHALGYCLGGTLLAIAAAVLARAHDERLATITLLAAQTDFTEAGELSLFVNESQLAFLEDVMWERGYLDSHQMSGSFQLLRSNDLIWSRQLKQYLMGEREPMTPLGAWNADGTRLPYRMHSEYLRRLFLDNDLAEGRYDVDGRPVALTDIRAPLFVVGTESDHIAPWRSVYKIHLFSDANVTFVLTNRGHNVGIVNPPDGDGRCYRIYSRSAQDRYIDPEHWLELAQYREGSWWPALAGWLADRCTGKSPPPPMGNAAQGLEPLADAPGTYVFER